MSETKTIVRSKVATSRKFDHVYDPTYSISDAKDLSKATAKAVYSSSNFKRLPDSVNMFSVLQHHPHTQVVLRPEHQAPSDMNHDYATQRVLRLQKAQTDYVTTDPLGKQHALHVARPVVSQVDTEFGTTYAPIRYATEVPEAAGRQRMVKFAEPETQAKTRTVEIQTDYRENDTQTDPWTPEYVVRPGSAPEVLTLANLAYGHGLPAGLAEVEMIERARAKRAWEKTLPSLNDPNSLDKRMQMMEEQEMREWKVREQEIEALQQERLNLLKQLLHQRDENQKEALDAKLEQLYRDRQQENKDKMAKLHATALKTVRALVKDRSNVEGDLTKRDVVFEYSNPGSSTFAPIAREGGSVADINAPSYVVESRYLKTYRGLLELEAALPLSVTQPRIVQPPRSKSARGKQERTALRLQETLARVDQTTKLAKTAQTPVAAPPLRYLERIEQPRVRPPTPTIFDEEQETNQATAEDDLNLAAITLQRLIRGRAMQNEMFEGRERRRELIMELRSTHALRENEKVLKEAELTETQQHNQGQAESKLNETVTKSVIAEVQGGHVGHMVDFLSKELVRLQEERRIHAIVMMAERQRRMREAEESGKRQVEERRRAQQDQVFREIVKVHQSTVDTYLEDIILDAKAATADAQARAVIRERATAVYKAADEIHASGYDQTQQGAQAIATELIASFLLPEVKKQTVRSNVQNNQRKFLHAAHKEIYATSLDIEREQQKRPKSAASEIPPLAEEDGEHMES